MNITKNDYYIINSDFKLAFNNPEYSPHIKTESIDIKIMIFRENLLVDVINDFNKKRYTFDGIVELYIITIANKMDMSYEFYIKHKMHAVAGKLIMIVAKNPHLMKSLNRYINHPQNRKKILLYHLLSIKCTEKILLQLNMILLLIEILQTIILNVQTMKIILL